MRCPYCSQEMKAGYIQCRDGLWWSEKVRPVAAVPPMSGNWKHIALDHGQSGPFRGNVAQAFFCEGCKKILLDGVE